MKKNKLILTKQTVKNLKVKSQVKTGTQATDTDNCLTIFCDTANSGCGTSGKFGGAA